MVDRRGPDRLVRVQPARDRPDGRLRPVHNPQFPEDGLDVNLDGRFGDVEPAGDDLVCVTCYKAPENFDFPVGQLRSSLPVSKALAPVRQTGTASASTICGGMNFSPWATRRSGLPRGSQDIAFTR